LILNKIKLLKQIMKNRYEKSIFHYFHSKEQQIYGKYFGFVG